MTRYYFAGAYARRAELAGRAMELEMAIASAQVVSRWLTDPQNGDDAGFCAEMLHLDSVATKAWTYGQRDIDDVRSARAVVSFTGEGARGGRHIEHGIALLLHDLHPITGYRLIVVGPREHVFHCHPATEVYADFGAFLKHEINGAGA